MKNPKSIFSSISILILLLLSSSTFGQFKGKMTFNNMGKERSFDVYSTENGYRYEFNEDGHDGAVIVNKNSQQVFILMPWKKMAIKSPANNLMSKMNDPLQAFEYYQSSGILKEAGKEKVNGINCTKSILYNKDNPSQKMFTVWYSDEYKFPMKMVNHIDGNKNSGMEMKDVEPWKPDPEKFEVPSGYNIMDVPGMPNK